MCVQFGENISFCFGVIDIFKYEKRKNDRWPTLFAFLCHLLSKLWQLGIGIKPGRYVSEFPMWFRVDRSNGF